MITDRRDLEHIWSVLGYVVEEVQGKTKYDREGQVCVPEKNLLIIKVQNSIQISF